MGIKDITPRAKEPSQFCYFVPKPKRRGQIRRPRRKGECIASSRKIKNMHKLEFSHNTLFSKVD